MISPASTLSRQLYMVLSPRALPYARTAIASLLFNSVEPVDLHLITDSAADRAELCEALHALAPDPRHCWSVTAEAELDDAEADRFAGLDNLRAFRHGHPCWRKVTDPLLLGAPGEELILLDPDLYFPNRFCFEPTPTRGLHLMWQQPNCLLPPEIVRRAMSAGIALARHVDIGVSHWRAGDDLQWMDWMLGKLGAPNLPRAMHVEAIVWSAIAMREGGGYLNPDLWVCWHRTQSKRVRQKLGVSGLRLLATEPWSTMKCFHAGGEAKWWVPDAIAARTSSPAQVLSSGQALSSNQALSSGRILPFVELSPTRYGCEQTAKNTLSRLGYHRVFGARA